MTKTLICTVGGSRAPVVTAIREHKPDLLVLVCSGNDPITGKAGSTSEVGAILAEAGFLAERATTICVAADDPADVIAKVAPRLEEAAAAGRCVADYTGGTKSMSAALFHLAVGRGDAEVSIVTGQRSNLVRVERGERARTLQVDTLRQGELLARVEACWQRFGYADAVRLIQSASAVERSPTSDRWEQLSIGFAHWDAWNHPAALEALEPFGRYVGAELPRLRTLASQSIPDAAGDAQRIVDIYLAAERRAEAHHFDAAVLRLYRALEWIAQWSLRWHHVIDCSDVASTAPVAQFATLDDVTDRHVLSCFRAWEALATLAGPLQETAATVTSSGSVRALAGLRNASVLAHGTKALGRPEYESAREALDRYVWPAFTRVAGRKLWLSQLPRVLPAER